MEITKEQLESYRSKRQEIRELKWNLENRWKSEELIGNNVIFDYGKGYPIPKSVVGFDQKRYERLQDRDLHRKEKLERECEEIEEFVYGIENSVDRRIFRLYFLKGEKKVSQEEVAIQLHLDRSRISRKIDEYLKNAHKAQKAQL